MPVVGAAQLAFGGVIAGVGGAQLAFAGETGAVGGAELAVGGVMTGTGGAQSALRDVISVCGLNRAVDVVPPHRDPKKVPPGVPEEMPPLFVGEKLAARGERANLVA